MYRFIALAVVFAATPSWSEATASSVSVGFGLIEVVNAESVSCSQLIDFDGVTGGVPPGTNYDHTLVIDEVQFAERFQGQTVSADTIFGIHDILDGLPSNPLTPQVGPPGENLVVLEFFPRQILLGLGPLRFPTFEAIGEGSISVWFEHDQSELRLDLVAGTARLFVGSATVSFFRRDGSLVGIVVHSSDQFDPEATFGYRHSSGLAEIAGFSIHNRDDSGIGIDDLCYGNGPLAMEGSSWGGIKSRYRPQ